MKKIIFTLAFMLMASPTIAQEPICTDLVRPDLCERLEKMGEKMVPMLENFLNRALEQGRLDLNNAIDEMLNEFERMERNSRQPTTPVRKINYEND